MGNFSAIGFDASSEEELRRSVDDALDRAAPPTELGDYGSNYLWFRDPSGAALAARLDARKAIECITPFFAAPDGGTRWRVRTSEPCLDRECLHCSGADCDVLDASGEMCTRTALQFLFFEPYRIWLEEERTYEIVVVGFAADLELCATPDDFERVQAARFGEAEAGVPREPGKLMRLADQAFLPHGMFGEKHDLGARARALLSGTVESLTVERNRITGGRFLHTRVHTYGAPIDIVAPADEVEVPERATLALADCWLVGRPVEAPPPKRGFFSRILGRG